MVDSTQVAELAPEEIVRRMDGVIRPHGSEADRTEAYLPSPVIQNHAAYLHFLPNGDLACAWFGGTMEGRGDISIWMSRLAQQAGRWSEAERLSDDPDRSEQNPVLFNAPDGTVWLFHTSQPGGRQDECEIVARKSGDGGLSFGPAKRIGQLPGRVCQKSGPGNPVRSLAVARFSLHRRKRRTVDRRRGQRRSRFILPTRARHGHLWNCPTAWALCT